MKTLHGINDFKWIFCAVLAFLCAFCAARADQPNFVVIMVDDMGYECIGANGCTEYSTPVVDNLASNGLRFSNAHSTPVCTPTRTQIMSGRYGHRNYTRFGQFVESETSFAELLREVGYATCMAGKWQLSGYDLDTTLDDFGFDEYALYNLPLFENASYPNSGEGRFWYPDIYTNGGNRIVTVETDYGPDLYTGFVTNFIARKAGEQPFLVYYAMALTHNPFVPTPHSTFAWPAGGAQEIYDTMDDPIWFKDMVEYSDYLTGRILQALDDAGVRDNTIVIFTGDNGTNIKVTTTTTHGDVVGGKNSVKKTGTHVPFIANWPSKTYSTNEITALYDHSDMLPTLVELAGAELPTDRVIDGISIAPILRGDSVTNARDAVFCEWFGTGRTKSTLRDFALDERYKYFINGEFYDMDADPEQVSPIAEAGMTPEMLAARDKLRNKIESVYSRTDDNMQLASNPGFENGLSKWRHFGNGWGSSNGMAVVTGTAGDLLDLRWMYQYHPAHPGQFYSAYADILTEGLDAGEAQAYLKIEFIDKNKAVIGTVLSNEVTTETNPERTIHIDNLVCPLNSQYLRLSLVVEPLAGGEFSVAFDRVLLKTGKLRNPDAEFKNNAGWIVSEGWNVSGVAEDASMGSFGFSTTIFETRTNTISQTVTAVPGETYSVSVDIRAAGNSGNLLLSAAYASGDGSAKNQVVNNGSVESVDRPHAGAYPTSNGKAFNGFFFFALPDLSGTDPSTISSVTYAGELAINTANNALGGFNCDVYGFGRNNLSLSGSDYQVPGSAYTGTLVQDDYLVPSTPTGAIYPINSAALKSLVQSLYNPDGTPAFNYLVLRIQPDWTSIPTLTLSARYRVNSHGSGLAVPTLQLEIPGGGESKVSFAYVQAEFLDAAGMVLTSHQGAAVTNDTAFSSHSISNLVAPSGTAFIRIAGVVEAPSAPGGNEYWSFDNFKLNDSTLPDLDRDGLSDADEVAQGTEVDRADSDADSIPDGWEVNNGLNPTNTADAAAHNDGDTFSNLEEYIAGTDPLDTGSFFAITNMDSISGMIEIEWASVEGRTYDVLWGTDLAASFTPIQQGIEHPQNSFTLSAGTNQTGFMKVDVRIKSNF
jgi:arylsulfatase A